MFSVRLEHLRPGMGATLANILHANWSKGLLHLWAEAGDSLRDTAAPGAHPFVPAAPPAGLLATLAGVTPPRVANAGTLVVRLPASGSRPLPSTPLARELGLATLEEDAVAGASIDAFTLPALTLDAGVVYAWLPNFVDGLSRRAELSAVGTGEAVGDARWLVGPSLEFFALLARFARHLLAQQRFVPLLVQREGELCGAWEPWVSDPASADRLRRIVGAMPPVARCVVDDARHDAWAVCDSFLAGVVDAACRQRLLSEDFADALTDRDPGADVHVAWLKGMLGEARAVPANAAQRQDMTRRVRAWVSVLEERGPSSQWRLMLRLAEPVGLAPDAAPSPEDKAWSVTFHLQNVDQPTLVLDAPDIWLLTGESATIMGRRIDRPQDLLLGELGRASRFYRALERALEDSKPEALDLSTRDAYEFLREIRPVLLEQGFAVEAPDWWDSPAARVGAKLKLESGQTDPFAPAAGGLTNAAKVQLGLAALVGYKWEIAVGDTTLSLHEFEQLAAKRSPLVRVNGRWVEIRPEDVHAAIKFIRENPGGQIRLADAMRMAYGSDLAKTGIAVVGLEASGWLQSFMNSESASRQITPLDLPKTFHGTLRPYQARGVSWLAFQEALGFGVCLADDMGLGKTVQLLALLAHEKDGKSQAGLPLQPTLLMVPMSVVGNWMHETKRFCPDLRLLVHHGPERALGDAFLAKVAESDLVVTTYALVHRDRELLGKVQWGRVVLDEAQYIKNPTAKQTQAVRSLSADKRVTLTGTPVENRLTELWSIMDFLNPGYLGSPGAFRARFAVAIERFHDKQRAEQLRALIRPFILRRLKSDPTVVADLPAKVESREYGYLTSEQASLYENCVKRMLNEVDQAEGMQRRGLVLSALIRLKQICNHPSLVLKDHQAGARPEPGRSGKCTRILEMLDEVIAEGDQALVFTQFREMGTLLEAMFRQQFGKDVLFIHGGTTQPQRQALIDRFQKADGTAPILVLSLRAGGVGLNLTAATHVFHFDRWWNPAVENQATDRAYRIGQTRTVQVHKFVVRGTLEERIDEMIESKIELADNIIGSGESWISDLSTDKLRDILALRNDAVDDEV